MYEMHFPLSLVSIHPEFSKLYHLCQSKALLYTLVDITCVHIEYVGKYYMHTLVHCAFPPFLEVSFLYQYTCIFSSVFNGCMAR